MNIGFIGMGNMAAAILAGLKNSGESKDTYYASARDYDKLQAKAENLNFIPLRSNRECAAKADLLILACKPEQLRQVADELVPLNPNLLLVSIAAKVTLATLKTTFASDNIVRVMPNLNVAIGQGVCALCADLPDTSAVEALFAPIAQVYRMDEALISAFIGIAGSSPAFVFRFIDTMIQPAIAEGMDAQQALQIACQAVSGSAQTLARSEQSAATLIQNVSSKGGTTIEGLKQLDALNFDQALIEAVKATIKKDKGI